MIDEIRSGLLEEVKDVNPRSMTGSGDVKDSGASSPDQKRGEDADGTDGGADSDGSDASDSDGSDASDADGTDSADADGSDNK